MYYLLQHLKGRQYVTLHIMLSLSYKRKAYQICVKQNQVSFLLFYIRVNKSIIKFESKKIVYSFTVVFTMI